MQGIENKGFAISFLIQDGLGMTLPRTLTGFYRDREVTGEYNIKEGLELANGMTVIEKGLNAGDKVLTSHLQMAARFKGMPLSVTVKEYEASKEE